MRCFRKGALFFQNLWAQVTGVFCQPLVFLRCCAFVWHISCFCIRLCLNWYWFILYCGDIVFQLAMIQVCHRQRSEWSCQCGACHVGEQGGHGTMLLQNVEAEGVTIGMFGRSCVIANYRSPSSMHENKDELKGGWGHWFFLAGLDLRVHVLHSCIELQYVPSNSCRMCGLLFPIVYFQWHGEAHVEKIRSLFSQLGAEKTGVITYAMKLGWSKLSPVHLRVVASRHF